jgi:choline-sulfatase
MARRRSKRLNQDRSHAPAAGKSRAPGRLRWRSIIVLCIGLAAAAGGTMAVLRLVGAPRTPTRASRYTVPSTGAAAGFNVLLITLDTVRADHLGCYGYATARTPNLDALAHSGLLFAQAIAPAPLTLPSHTTMLTGQDPPTHGVRDNGFHVADSQVTLAEMLADQGYATAAFVSSFVLDERFGLAQGFAVYDGISTPSEDSRQSVGTADANRRPAADVTNAALSWLSSASRAGKPFFAWIHYFDAHFPYLPPPQYAAQFPMRPYDGAIAYVDAQVGRVFDLLRRTGAERRTLVVVAGDHGEGLEQHGESTHAYLIYDSTMHVPLILHNATLFGAPRVVADRVVSLADIVPTVLDLLGLAASGPLDGRRLLEEPPDADRAIYIETMASRLNNGWASLHGLRRLHDKYILAPEPEYYDVRTDPRERHNLAAAAPPGMTDLSVRLAARMARATPLDQVIQQATALTPEDVQRLASLGYVRASSTGAPMGAANPKDMLPVWKRVMSAEISSLRGQHAEAVAEIERVLEEDPTDGHAWYYAASIYKRCGRMEDAERATRQALALSPSAAGYVSLAQLLLVRGSLGDEFEWALDEAQNLDAENGGIYIARGDWHLLQGRPQEAIEAYEEAGRVDPVNWARTAREKIALVRQRQ